MELKAIVSEYLDIQRKLSKSNLPDSLEHSLKFRLMDLDDIISHESCKSTFPSTDLESYEVMLELINNIEMYKAFEDKNEENRIYIKDELLFLTKELAKYDSGKIKEYYQIEVEHDGYSFERKKIKDGAYEYFVANLDGKLVTKFPKNFFDVEEHYMWDRHDACLIYRYEFIISSYETKIPIDSDLIDGDNEDSFEYDEISDQYFEIKEHEEETENPYGIINLNGDVIFKGCDSVAEVDAKGEFQFILRLNCIIHKDKRPKEYNSKNDGIWCVIDNKGNFIIDPTINGIRYNTLLRRYEFFNFILNH